jgi:enoyl-CoA hydratase/carnithine racemase
MTATHNGHSTDIRVDTTPEGIATLTIDRAHRGNALSFHVLDDIEAAAHRIAVDRDVRAVIITGAGDRAFSAGADITELAGLDHTGGVQLAAHGQRAFDAVADLPQPVIAAVNGVAFGGGLELALACDVRIAAEHAAFAFPEITLANAPGWGGTYRLPQVIGAGRARHMLLGGEPITTHTALTYGLVTDVVPTADLRARADQIARKLGEHSAHAAAAVKRAIQAGIDGGSIAGQIAERDAVGLCSGSPEQVAAVAAFLDRKTKPQP